MGNFEKIAIRNGLMVLAGLIAYFFLMKWLGYVHNTNLRALNGVILFTGVYMAIRSYKKKHDDHIEYLNGLGVGVITALIPAFAFALFTGFYVAAHPGFMAAIQANEPQGIHMDPFSVTLIIFIEALASGMMFSYISMQWMKDRVDAPATKDKHSERFSNAH